MAAFIMSGRLQAILFTLGMTLLSFVFAPLGILGNAAVALVTLRLGFQQGFLIALPTAVGLSLLVMLMEGDVWVGFLSGLISWLPIIVLGTILGRTVSWSQVLQSLLVILAVLIVGFHLAVGDTGATWDRWLQNLVTLLQIEDAEQQVTLSAMFKQAAPYMTGALASLLGIHWIISLMVGRHWQAKLYNPGGFEQELYQIRLGKPLALGMVALIGVALITQQALAIDLVLAGLAVFLFAGLSLVHYSFKAWQLPIIGLAAVYILLLLFPVYSGVLLAAFGIIDSQADFRKYITARSS